MLTTDRRANLLAFVGGSEIGRVALDDCILELERAADSRVLRKIGIDGCDGSVFYMLRCREMRLARSDVHYVNTLLAQFFGLGRSGHGGRRLDPVNAFRQADGVGNGGHYAAHDLFFLELVFRT